MLTESSSGAITIRTWRGRLQFDDQGITVKNLFRSYQIAWSEVRRFWDLVVQPADGDPISWALIIVLHDGRTVTARATAASWPPPSQTLVAVGQTAQRYGIPADMAGAIKRDSFPAALLGASGTISVTIRDGLDVHEPILDVIERTEPVEPGDILALSHHGTDTEVVGTRQIFAGGRWEQVAWVRYDLCPVRIA
jgi:hypothetical protein